MEIITKKQSLKELAEVLVLNKIKYRNSYNQFLKHQKLAIFKARDISAKNKSFSEETLNVISNNYTFLKFNAKNYNAGLEIFNALSEKEQGKVKKEIEKQLINLSKKEQEKNATTTKFEVSNIVSGKVSEVSWLGEYAEYRLFVIERAKRKTEINKLLSKIITLKDNLENVKEVAGKSVVDLINKEITAKQKELKHQTSFYKQSNKKVVQLKKVVEGLTNRNIDEIELGKSK